VCGTFWVNGLDWKNLNHKSIFTSFPGVNQTRGNTEDSAIHLRWILAKKTQQDFDLIDFRWDNLSVYLSMYLFWYWGLNSGPTPWATLPTLFCDGFFWDRVSRTICQGWLWTMILQISASWVARIIGVSHQCLAYLFIYLLYYCCTGGTLWHLQKWL
jgi:hypothetical protein